MNSTPFGERISLPSDGLDEGRKSGMNPRDQGAPAGGLGKTWSWDRPRDADGSRKGWEDRAERRAPGPGRKRERWGRREVGEARRRMKKAQIPLLWRERGEGRAAMRRSFGQKERRSRAKSDTSFQIDRSKQDRYAEFLTANGNLRMFPKA